MAEEDAIFDPTMKKRKKKKKTPFDLDAALGGEGGNTEETPAQDENMQEETTQDGPTKDKSEDLGLDDDFSGLAKKKKKKKKPFDFSEIDDALPKEETPSTDNFDAMDSGPMLDLNEDEFDLSLPMKKKKKKKVKIELGDDGEIHEETEESQEAPSSQVDGTTTTMMDSDRDYTYDELLKRVFDIMREKNPDMVAGEKKRFVMKPPQVMRVGTKKSSFSNFAEICKMLHRQPKHLLAFLLAELGTSGSVDGNNQLIIKGRFQQKQIENVLRRYIKEYVTCHTCRSPDTILQKDTRIFFLQCEMCGSRCSVASIKSGFQAVTGKRAAIRAKTS